MNGRPSIFRFAAVLFRKMFRCTEYVYEDNETVMAVHWVLVQVNYLDTWFNFYFLFDSIHF